MDRETLTKQMKALKKKAKDTKTAGAKEVAAQFHKAASRLRRKLQRMAPSVVAAKADEA